MAPTDILLPRDCVDASTDARTNKSMSRKTA